MIHVVLIFHSSKIIYSSFFFISWKTEQKWTRSKSGPHVPCMCIKMNNSKNIFPPKIPIKKNKYRHSHVPNYFVKLICIMNLDTDLSSPLFVTMMDKIQVYFLHQRYKWLSDLIKSHLHILDMRNWKVKEQQRMYLKIS